MSKMTKQSEKAEERESPRPKKPPGLWKFQKLLKQVVNAPPLHRPKVSSKN